MTMGDSRCTVQRMTDVDVHKDEGSGTSRTPESCGPEVTKGASSRMKTEKEDVANGVRRSIAFAALIGADEVRRKPARLCFAAFLLTAVSRWLTFCTVA